MCKTETITIDVVPLKKDPLSTNSKNLKAEFFSNDQVLNLYLAKKALEDEDAEEKIFTVRK